MIENLTPHDIRIVDGDGVLVHEFPSSGRVARVSVTREQVGSVRVGCPELIQDIPVYREVYGVVEGLPVLESIPGCSNYRYYIVSAMVRQALPHRLDLLSPGDLVRGPDGQPVGCRGFVGNSGGSA